MLNSKKSFLQKARIAMVAIVTIMSIGGAYAMNAPKHQSGTTWGVVSTTANNYQVTAVTAHSQCATDPSAVCKITTTTPPDRMGNISKTDPNITSTVSGDFSK